MYSLSQPIFSALLLLSSTLLVVVDAAPHQHVYQKTGQFGGWDGDAFSYMCNPGAFLTSVAALGSSGGSLTQLTFTCSDTYTSDPFGPSGGPALPTATFPNGASSFTVAHGDLIYFLGFGGASVGSSGGATIESWSSEAGCLIIGVNGRVSEWSVVGISFSFKCPTGTPVALKASLNQNVILGALDGGGDAFSYECNPGAFIQRIQGSFTSSLHSLSFTCSDSTVAWTAGTSQGSTFDLGQSATPISVIMASAGQQIDTIGYNSTSAGITQSGSGIFVFQDGNGGGATGVSGRVSDIITSLGFHFQSPPKSIKGAVAPLFILVGGVGGNAAMFTCTPGNHITQVLTVSDGTALDQIQVYCSDKGGSPVYGTSVGGNLLMPFAPYGIQSFTVDSNSQVRNIFYETVSANNMKSDTYSLIQDPNGCPAVGIMVGQSDMIYSIGFMFQC